MQAISLRASRKSWRRRPSAPAFLAGAALLALVATPALALQNVTPRGVGAVTLGARYTTLHARGLVGDIGPGCELAGPQARSAKLQAPLSGSVDFTMTAPRRVATINIRGGAAARGIHIGSTAQALRAAFPSAHFDHSTDGTFGATFVKVGRRGGGPLGFTVGTATQSVQLIAVPNVVACE